MWRVLQSSACACMYSGYLGLLCVDLSALSVLSGLNPAHLDDSGGTQHDIFFHFLYAGEDRECVMSGDEEGELSVDDLDTTVHSHPHFGGNAGYVLKLIHIHSIGLCTTTHWEINIII